MTSTHFSSNSSLMLLLPLILESSSTGRNTAAAFVNKLFIKVAIN